MFWGKKRCFWGNFFRIPSAMGGGGCGVGGYPPIPLIFVVVKNRPKKSVFWAKNVFFLRKFFRFPSGMGGE